VVSWDDLRMDSYRNEGKPERQGCSCISGLAQTFHGQGKTSNGEITR
jgi:hypothetical protein